MLINMVSVAIFNFIMPNETSSRQLLLRFRVILYMHWGFIYWDMDEALFVE